MALTSGFFNSKNHDRLYDATQIATLFEGLINDGVYQGVGNIFKVSASSGMRVTVDTGRAWFNNTWTRNDALIVLTVPTAEQVLKRIDAVVLEVNTLENVRNNTIKIVKGTPASSPAKPSLTKNDDVHQYPLAYITVDPNVTTITQQKIQNAVGTSACPFVTGIIKTLDIDDLIMQWSTEFNCLFAELQTKISQAASQTLIDGSVTRKKLANDALFSPNVYVSASRKLQASDLGKKLFASGNNNNCVLTLDDAASAEFTVGSEIFLAWINASSPLSIKFSKVNFVLKGSKEVNTTTKDVTVKLVEQGSAASLMKYNNADGTVNSRWLLTGDVEVVT